MFEHPIFEKYSMEEIPLNTDLYLRDEIFIEEFESSLIKVENGGEWEPVGYVSNIAARRINSSSIELSWFPNIFDRFHELTIVLPRDQIVACVGCSNQDEDVSIFVKSEWLKNLYLKTHSVFGLIDVIGIKDALNEGRLTREKLLILRSGIDGLAQQFSDVSFISFADSLLLKRNWTVGHFQHKTRYTYNPEIFLHLFQKIKELYRSVLGLNIYGVFTQGSNEYYSDHLLHISESKNHVCLNSLGAPFAELKAIEEAARRAIRDKVHAPFEIYMDKHYFNSLKLKYEFKKEKCKKHFYQTIMHKTSAAYFCISCDEIIANLK